MTTSAIPVHHQTTARTGSFARFLAAVAERKENHSARGAETRHALAAQVRAPGVLVRRG